MIRKRARSRVVVLGGAGAMGRIVARDLAKYGSDEIETVIADRDPGPARPLRLEMIPCDVTSRRSLSRALHGADAVIASLPYRFNLPAMQGALAAHCHYIDLGGLYHVTRRQLRHAAEFRKAGLMAVLGMGSSPGITNVLARLAARNLTTILQIHCEVANVDRTRWSSEPPVRFGYSPDTLLDELTMPSAVFRDGAVRFVPPLDPAERRTMRFPEPIGERALDTTLHSEIATLPASFRERGVREVTFRQSFDPAFLERAKLVVDLGLGDPRPLDGLPVSSREILLKLLKRFPSPVRESPPDAHEILRVVVSGERDGRAEVVVAECSAGPEAGDATGPDIDTGAPPSIVALLLLATGEIKLLPGVWAPEHVVPVEPFVRELERRGMRVAVRSSSTRERRRPRAASPSRGSRPRGRR